MYIYVYMIAFVNTSHMKTARECPSGETYVFRDHTAILYVLHPRSDCFVFIPPPWIIPPHPGRLPHCCPNDIIVRSRA